MNRSRKNRNHSVTNTPIPDATEAALSRILPPTAFEVFRTFLGLARSMHHAPEMSMREALELMEVGRGFGELAAAVFGCDPSVDIRQLARLFEPRAA